MQAQAGGRQEEERMLIQLPNTSSTSLLAYAPSYHAIPSYQPAYAYADAGSRRTLTG
jgi:hypothetical protein